jgi:hypothetical protein
MVHQLLDKNTTIMDLKLVEKFKFLEPFEEINLPDFIVLTGLNGSGKTQLLVGLNGKKISVTYDNKKDNEIVTKYIPIHGLGMYIQDQAYDKEVYPYLGNIWEAIENALRNVRNSKDKNIVPYVSDNGDITDVFKRIKESYGKDILEISYEELKLHYPTINREDDLFRLNISHIYKRYRDKWCLNNYFQYLAKEGKDSPQLSNEDFVIKNGIPPWELVNKILEEAKINYKTNYPDYLDHRQSFKLVLTNLIDTESEIGFKDMSSGEIVLT